LNEEFNREEEGDFAGKIRLGESASLKKSESSLKSPTLEFDPVNSQIKFYQKQ
jgi:hypothetical protein